MAKNKDSFKQIESNVPMWAIDNDKLKIYAKNIAKVSLELKSLERELKELSDKIESFNNRLNIYLSNVFEIPNFEHSQHALLIKENNEIAIYPIEMIQNQNDIDFDNLPEPKYTKKLSHKRMLKVFNQLKEFNELVDEFNSYLEEYEEFLKEHSTLWKEVKELVKNLTIISVRDNNDTEDDFEEFDEDKHVLVIVQDINNEWGFRYIKKEDEEEFNKFVLSQFDID